MSKSFLSSIFIVGLMGYWRLSPVPWLRYERLTCCCMILLEIRGFFTTHFHAFSNVTLLFWAVMFCNLVDILFYFFSFISFFPYVFHLKTVQEDELLLLQQFGWKSF